ncbi:MAG: dihydrolipoamide acetyltransferase family protein, partial [Mycobacterium sp.]
MIEFKMPALGSDMDEGKLNEWLVKPGDTISHGQVVAVVETTKAAVEVECWQEGVVQELLVPVGETVQVGTVLATLLVPGESEASAPRQPEKGTHAPAAVEATPAVPMTSTAAAAPRPDIHRRRFVSPAARRVATRLGVDTDTVTGTGPQGSVTIKDVEDAAAAVKTPAAAVQTPATAVQTPVASAKKQAAADRAAEMRKSIAAAMSRSKREIPHYYLVEEILLDKSLAWLSERNAQRPITERVLPAVLQLKAVALAAQRFTEFNGFWRNNGFEPAPGVHVGVAITLRGGGLVAPAIHDVAEKNLDELMGDLTDLVARARAGSLRSSEMSDPSITVTNLGDEGVDAVFGVIYPPQVALVGFGKPMQRVCAVDGGIRIVTAVQASLAADHRASDGHRGALFLNAIGEY